jgi:TIR domain-containing protein
MTPSDPTTPPLRIFISYRRDETSGHAGRLYDALADRFGPEHVFMDVDAIDLGADFARVIAGAVTSCDVVIAVIGRAWLTAADEAGRRRLDEPDDFVRIELASALARDVFVIPACVQGAAIPPVRELPEELAQLSRRQGVELRDGAWHDDVRRLIRRLERLAAEKARPVEPIPPAEAPGAPPPRPGRRRRLPLLVAALVALGAGAAALALTLGGGGGGTASGGSAAVRLRALVPSAVRPTCEAIDYGEKSAEGSLGCSGERVAIEYHLFGSADALGQWYVLRREEQRLEPGSGTCASGRFRGEGPYEVGGREVGRRFCFVSSKGEAYIFWTDLGSRVGAQANVYEGKGPAAARSLLRQWRCCFVIER